MNAANSNSYEVSLEASAGLERRLTVRLPNAEIERDQVRSKPRHIGRQRADADAVVDRGRERRARVHAHRRDAFDGRKAEAATKFILADLRRDLVDQAMMLHVGEALGRSVKLDVAR